MIRTKLQNEFKKFFKIAEGINSYNLREHTIRKLKYDFEKFNNMEDKDLDENFFERLEIDFERLNRIKLMQNMYIEFEEFPYKTNNHPKI